MKIAICEDDRFDMYQIKQELMSVKHILLIDMDIETYTSGEVLLSALKHGSIYDILLLDIYLNAENGIDIARKCKAMDPNIQLAFITSSRDYAIDAFVLDALHYLTKPIQSQQLQEMIKRYFARLHCSIKKLQILTETKKYEFSISTIQKIISAKKGIDIYVSYQSDPIHIQISFKKTEELVDKDALIKISRGYVIHMDHILQIYHNQCMLKDGTSVLISRRHLHEVKQTYYEYIQKSRIK